jgi:hypothetical protein
MNAMKLRDLLIAAGVLAVLLGVLYWSNHRKAGEDTTVKASPDAPVRILSLNQTDIIRLSIHRKDQPPVDLSRNGSGAWQIIAPKTLAADQEAVSSVLSALSPLNSSRLLEEKTSDLASYGLTAPAVELEVTLKGNQTQKLLIGDETPSGNDYYVMLAGDPRLFTLASYNKTSLDKTAGDLRDKRLLTADFDKVSQIEFIGQQSGKKQDITFARNKDAWEILKPKPWRADSDKVDDLIRSLRDAKMESTSETADDEAAKAFRSASPYATVKVTGTPGAQELEVRKAKDDYYAKSSVVAGSFKVPVSLGTSLDKSLDDFRNRKLFDFGYAEPNKIEIHDGSKAYYLARATSDWWGPDGKKLDESSAQSLVGKLRDLSAEKFPDSGFTTPALDLTVYSNDGKRIEKVGIAKNGEIYIAKREGEPSLYEVSSTAVTELEKSAADVKPAAPPAPQKK